MLILDGVGMPTRSTESMNEIFANWPFLLRGSINHQQTMNCKARPPRTHVAGASGARPPNGDTRAGARGGLQPDPQPGEVRSGVRPGLFETKNLEPYIYIYIYICQFICIHICSYTHISLCSYVYVYRLSGRPRTH